MGPSRSGDGVGAEVGLVTRGREKTYVELVQLGPHTSSRDSLLGVGQENLSNGVNDAELVGAEVGRESRAIHFGGLAIGFVQHILVVVSKRCRLAFIKKLSQTSFSIGVGDRECQLGATLGRIPANGDGRGSAGIVLVAAELSGILGRHGGGGSLLSEC
jgi:hypothetical protein